MPDRVDEQPHRRHLEHDGGRAEERGERGPAGAVDTVADRRRAALAAQCVAVEGLGGVLVWVGGWWTRRRRGWQRRAGRRLLRGPRRQYAGRWGRGVRRRHEAVER